MALYISQLITPGVSLFARTGKLPQRFQRDLGCPVLPSKINRFRRRANHLYKLAPSHPKEGRLAIVTNARWDAVDAAASARDVMAGQAGSACERSNGEQTNGACADGKAVWSWHPLLVSSWRR